MRLFLLVSILLAVVGGVIATQNKHTSVIEVVNTPKFLFYDILEIFKVSRKFEEQDYMDELFSIRDSNDFDEECHQILSDIIRTRDRSNNLKVAKKRDHRIRTKMLEKFVRTYINHQVNNPHNGSKDKLTKTLYALRAQEITNSMITERSLWSILKHIKIKLVEYDLIDEENRLEISTLNKEESEKYVANTVIYFAKGIIILGICSVLSPTLCLGIVGSLLFIQVVLWMLVLVGLFTVGNVAV